MNIYCFSTLSFAKLQFKSVINKAFHKHGVASFTDAWIETAILFPVFMLPCRIFYRCVDWNQDVWSRISQRSQSHLLQMRGLKQNQPYKHYHPHRRIFYRCVDWNTLQVEPLIIEYVASFTDAWIETLIPKSGKLAILSHLLQMRGLKLKELR